MSENDRGESPIDAQLVAPPLSQQQTPAAVASSPKSGMTSELIQSRGAVLAMLFLATGALGIPLLWMNRNFSDTERIVWAIIVTIYTLILIAIAAAIVMWSYRQVFGY